jgi:peptide/nickel transport system permease protein
LTGYIIKRLSYGLLVLWGVASLVFFLFNVLPGDPARMMLDQREGAEQLQNIRAKYGFDRPISEQYFLYLNDLSPVSLHHTSAEAYTSLSSDKYVATTLFTIGNYQLALKSPYLRTSFKKTGKTVSSIIADTLPNTVVLAVSAILIAIFLGLLVGVLAAIWKDSWLDRSALFFGVLGMSVPSFFSAILVAWVFGFLLSDWTGLNMTGSLYSVDDYGNGEYLSLSNLILPALTLGIRPLAVIIQLTRSAVLDTLSQDYVRTAVAKGLSFPKVLWKHVMRNSMNPVVTAVSGWFASLLAGAVFIEYIFAWNGLGKEIVEALSSLDLPVVMGSVLTIASLFVGINILVDLTYGWLDPRIRIQK